MHVLQGGLGPDKGVRAPADPGGQVDGLKRYNPAVRRRTAAGGRNLPGAAFS